MGTTVKKLDPYMPKPKEIFLCRLIFSVFDLKRFFIPLHKHSLKYAFYGVFYTHNIQNIHLQHDFHVLL